jgi:mannose-6-phosphate isomerase-like protein (cupin superfamily)
MVMSDIDLMQQAISLGNVQFAQEEMERRRSSPVFVSGDKAAAYREAKGGIGIVHLIDPKLGFNVRSIRLWINRAGALEKGWEGWKLLGHRHLIDAVIYIVEGTGYSIIDGVRYDWTSGDFMCVPTFAWHRHVNLTDQPVTYVASTSTPYSQSIGVSIHEDERYPEYWVFAQKSEEAQKTLIPGGAETPADGFPGSKSVSEFRGDQGLSAYLYEQQVEFAAAEEKRRRAGRVVVRGGDLNFGPTRMGNLAYVIDSRLGFNTKVMSTVVAEIPPGKRSGAHRHLYEEVNYIMSGEGYSIVDDRRYDWKAGDALSIPVFAWHQYFNTGSEPARILSHSNRAAMDNMGIQVTQQGEPANY